MTLIGEVSVQMDTSDTIFKTSYIKFYSSMIRIPFLGANFNTIMPIFILILGLIFGLLSLLKCKNRALGAIQKYSNGESKKEEAKDKNKKKAQD